MHDTTHSCHFKLYWVPRLLPQTAFFDPSRDDIKRGKTKRGARVPWTFQPVHGFPQWTFSLANIQITSAATLVLSTWLGLVRRWQTSKTGWKTVLSAEVRQHLKTVFNFSGRSGTVLPGWSQQLLQHFYNGQKIKINLEEKKTVSSHLRFIKMSWTILI